MPEISNQKNVTQNSEGIIESTDSKTLIDSLSQLKQITCDSFSSASRMIQIYSHNLDTRILNNREIEKSLIRLIKRTRAARIQILIYTEQSLIGIDHRLVALAQRFTSYVEIRVVPRDNHENIFGFYMIDRKCLIYRSNVERYDAEKSHLPYSRVKEKSILFDSVWQSSTPASFLRSLHL